MDNPIALPLGASPLNAEESSSFTLGAVWTIDMFSITVDYYEIEIEDRLALLNNTVGAEK